MSLDKTLFKALRAGGLGHKAALLLADKSSKYALGGGGLPAPLGVGLSGGFGVDLLSGTLAVPNDGASAASGNLEPILLESSAYVPGSVDNAYMSYAETDSHFIVKQRGWYLCHCFAQLAAPIAKPVRVVPVVYGGRPPELDIPAGSTRLANSALVYADVNAPASLSFLAQGTPATVSYFFMALTPMFALAES